MAATTKMSNKTFFVTTLLALIVMVPAFMFFLNIFFQGVNGFIKLFNSFI